MFGNFMATWESNANACGITMDQLQFTDKWIIFGCLGIFTHEY